MQGLIVSPDAASTDVEVSMAKRQKAKVRPKSHPKKMSSNELCKRLCGVAAFQVEDQGAQKLVYEAVRRLQQLDAAARDHGILPKRGG